MLSYKKILVFNLILVFGFGYSSTSFSQEFAPQIGFAGTNAMHVDSCEFIAWAKTCIVTRGYINIQDTNATFQGSNKAVFGSDSLAIGKADGIMNVVSLGDGGSAILSFYPPITNSTGADFAVFENALISQNNPKMAFLELAFVEVSSDGQNFFRFPSISQVQFITQTGTFENTNAANIHNLAGKYPSKYGTPFDLEDLQEYSSELNLNSITHIKIIDVIGTINETYSCFDSYENIINDPFPTPFASCGFDLDAIGVLNQKNILESDIKVLVYPNPASNIINIYSDTIIDKIIISNIFGQQIFEQNIHNNNIEIDISSFQNGIYIVSVFTNKIINVTLCKN